MPDPVPARKIADLIGGSVMGGRPEMMIEGVASINHLQGRRLIFVKKLTVEFNSRLGAVPEIFLPTPDKDSDTKPDYAHIRCVAPRLAFARVVTEVDQQAESKHLAARLDPSHRQYWTECDNS